MGGRPQPRNIIREAPPPRLAAGAASHARQDWCLKWFNERYTYCDIGTALGISRERASQLVRKAKARRAAAQIPNAEAAE